MWPVRGAGFLLLLALSLRGSASDTRFFLKMRTNESSDPFQTRSQGSRGIYVDSHRKLQVSDDEGMIRDTLDSQSERRNGFTETSTFNPDVLNKFLEEYASKIKSTTDRNGKYPFMSSTEEPVKLLVEEEVTGTTTQRFVENHLSADNSENPALNLDELKDDLNDTLKRNKYWNANSNDDRNGWVTLDAVPWSKSKISKWQANANVQRPWPDQKPWEKPNSGKPWPGEFNSRPEYESNKPWYNKPKPQWDDNADDEKPWEKPSETDRPTYQAQRPSSSYYGDSYNEHSQTQKWPPERPSSPWPNSDTYHRPNSDIITDERPANFPSTWSNNRPVSEGPKPGGHYGFPDRYQSSSSSTHDKYDKLIDRPRPMSDRPHFAQYQYNSDRYEPGGHHQGHPPSTHPSSGDGQWVLLSTNRGYSKSRQRSIKVDTLNGETLKRSNSTSLRKEESDPAIAVMTSKRQVRLTVLPSINGTNTTTSHGGLLEVERTFKTVDQSQKEYERNKLGAAKLPFRVIASGKRPIRNSVTGGMPSGAVLAAVGAGMVPATMAMMIPIMLGKRKRRSVVNHLFENPRQLPRWDPAFGGSSRSRPR